MNTWAMLRRRRSTIAHGSSPASRALAQQQPLDGVERTLATLGRIVALPGRILDRHIEKREERRQQGLERPVETEHPAHHLVAHLPVRVPVADLEIALSRSITGR